LHLFTLVIADYIDLYYQHRVDPNTPQEEVMAVLKELHEAGKIRYVGISECTAAELRRSHAVFPVSAIQMEWSLQTRDIEAEIVPTARELGIGIVTYSPLGRGFLSQTFKSRSEIAEGDFRAAQPRYADACVSTYEPLWRIATCNYRRNLNQSHAYM
jgi:aryl-alcohol dehydrogenase-like predicted oxidoreductase